MSTTSLAYLSKNKPEPLASQGVGDIHGTAQGSGARFNAGKPAFDLVPLRLVAASLRGAGQRQDAVDALACLGQWQERQDRERLYEALTLLGMGGWPECARVFDYGAKKYSGWNWARGMAWSIPLACAARHLLALIGGEANDPESGLPHRGHIFCNVAMLLTYETTYPEGDDRPAAGLLSPVTAAV